MIPRRVRVAILIAFFCHGLFILTARYRLSYDAYTHMLFANHYAENWFSLWETRWYTGFTVVAYPPLTHQLIALFIPMLGFDKAFALILWIVTTLYPLGIYAFARIFTGKISASYAALASALLLPIYVTAHIFGQLPFLTSTLLALFSAASLDRYIRDGGTHNFFLTVSLYTTTMAAHHATLLVHPFLIVAVITKNLFNRGDTESLRKTNLRVFMSPWLAPRLIIFTLITTITSLLVIFPFWQWGMDQTLQTPIDHLSRHNFFTDPFALAIFFFPLYGPLIAVIPFLFRKWQRRCLGLLISFIILFLLGLGGTTPLPRLFFGDAWEWLTYDRFAFWACLTLTPFFGILFIRMQKKLRLFSKLISATLRKKISSPESFSPLCTSCPSWLKKFTPSRLIVMITFSIFAVTALGSWFTPIFFVTQPDPIDMQPIVDFLNAGNNSQWRYLTFGFGDQFTYLNLLTKATTTDGSYHTARTLPELRASGIGQVDTSYWALNGMHAIVPILQKSGAHGVRWGFINPDTLTATKVRWGVLHRSPFIPVLEQLGWIKIKTLENGVVIYENPNARLPLSSKPPITKPITSFAWGVFPILSLITTLSLAGLRIYPIQSERINQAIYFLAISLIPITLCFWIFQPIAEFQQPRVYFTYTNALFFFSDALVLFAINLWASTKITAPHATYYPVAERSGRPMPRASSFILLFSTLCFLTTLSIFWSRDWHASLYISLHFWLVCLLTLSLRDWHAVWKVAMFGLCAALSIQVVTGFIGFALQSTEFLKIDMNWPGALDPSIRGASVVQLADGLRILRAYGTLPHPNILGGFALLTLLGPASLFLTNKKPNYPALLLYSFGIILIGLTFSRSAWLGLSAFIVSLILKSKHINRKQLFLFVSVSLLTMTLTLYPLRDLVFTRISNAPVATEQLSTFGRSWLTQQAFGLIRAYPLTGVGIGAFAIKLADYAIEGALIEPVHNIFLLVGSELGIFGLLLMLALYISIALNIFKAQTPHAILASATLAGLGVIGLFDHYLWTLAPGRIMLGLALGLWIGQINHDA